MEVLWLSVLTVASFHIGFISCDDDISAGGKGVDIVGLLNRMDEFEKRENDREREQTLLRIEMKELQMKVENLETENDLLKRDIAQLTEIINKDENNPENHKNDSDALKTVIRVEQYGEEPERMEMTRDSKDDLKEEIVKGNYGDLIHTINRRAPATSGDNKKRIENGVRQSNGANSELGVAFYAVLTSHLTHAGINQTVVFDKAYTNVGNAYSIYSGDFRAPVSGLYVFSTTLLAYASHTTQYHVVKNGAQVGNLYLHGSESPHMTDSLTIVLYLNAGDDVAVKNMYADENLHGLEYSSFSGFLLQQDYTPTNIVG